MQTPQDQSIDAYDYALPDARIARYPLEQRDASKLLVYARGQLRESVFRQLPDELPAGALLVFNNTRVIHARLQALLPGGAPLEILLLEPAAPVDYQLNFSARAPVRWVCLVGGNRKWKSGVLTLEVPVSGRQVNLLAERLDRQPEGSFVVQFSWDDAAYAFGEVLAAAGVIPLPPYLNRAAEAADTERYQTVYAQQQGSVAAPTAGLHFTTEVLANLTQRGVNSAYVTLHVGAGTFKPVSSHTLGGHDMHRESIVVSRQVVTQLCDTLRHQRPVLAVGTTSLRTLESLYWFGHKLLTQPHLSFSQLEVGQWDPYQQPPDTGPTAVEALEAVLAWMGPRTELEGHTQLLVAPGYTYQVIQGLLTNFHQPRSTLLLLVAALIGDDWKKVYDFALAHDFRFLSYGDSSLLWGPQAPR